MKYVIFLTILFLSNLSYSKCLTYTVKKGDYLSKIAKNQLGSKDKWYLPIYVNSQLKSKKLKIGQKLYIYEPDANDWAYACQNIVSSRLIKTNNEDKIQLAIDIPVAIEIASEITNLNPEQKLRYCRLVVTTAEQESYYKFAVGAVGEIGMFQFRLNTARDVLRRYDLITSNKDIIVGNLHDLMVTDLSDRTMVTYLLDNHRAIAIYMLHMIYLRKHCSNQWCAFKRYNGSGNAAIIYAERAMSKYKEIRQIAPMPKCGENNELF